MLLASKLREMCPSVSDCEPLLKSGVQLENVISADHPDHSLLNKLVSNAIEANEEKKTVQ